MAAAGKIGAVCAWPEAKLHIVLSGHAASEPMILDQRVQTTEHLADRFD